MARHDGRSNLKRPKKGAVLNPYGRYGKDPAQNALKRFGRREFVTILDLVLTSNITGLREVIEDDESSAFKVGMARAMLNACEEGDWKILESIVDRVVGKVAVRFDHTSKGEKIADPAQKVILYLPENGRTAEENTSTADDDGYDLGF